MRRKVSMKVTTGSLSLIGKNSERENVVSGSEQFRSENYCKYQSLVKLIYVVRT